MQTYGREIIRPGLYTKSASDLCDIGFGVEVPEQDDEREHVNYESVLHPERKVASRSNAIDSQNQSSRKLDELEDCQVLLPPEVLGHRRT